MDQKAPEAFRTISEVAEELDVPQHVLRFWETRFHEIRPMKRGGGRRYYRPDDVDLLRGIRHLLYGEGYTIRGVQRILSEEGQKFVQAVWQTGAPQPPHGGSEAADDKAEDFVEDDAQDAGGGLRDRLTSFIGRDLGATHEELQRREPSIAPPAPKPVAPVVSAVPVASPVTRLEPRIDPPPFDAPGAERFQEPRFESVQPPSVDPPVQGAPVQGAQLGAQLGAPLVAPVVADPRTDFAPAPTPSFPTPQLPLNAGTHDPLRAAPGFAREDLRRLQAALHELAECKKLLNALARS